MTDDKRKELLLKAKPILFNTDMIRAILDGRKTVTRRVLKNQDSRAFDYDYNYDTDGIARSVDLVCDNGNNGLWAETNKIPYFENDILYVRETWCKLTDWKDQYPDDEEDMLITYYRADYSDDMAELATWHPSVHMPKEAARIFLRVTDVKVERLQDITEVQAMAEGIFLDSPNFIPTYHYSKDKCDIPGKGWNTARECFQRGLWDNTIKKSDLDKYGWAANPWVWAIEFERID